MLVRDRPLLFTNYDSTRVTVQKVRDEAGKPARGNHCAPENKVLRTAPKRWDDLPKPKEEFDGGWNSVEINGDYTTLILSDIHIPYHDKQALLVALEMGRKRKVNHVLLNGDIGDFYSVSRFEKNPEKRDVASEKEDMVDFFEVLREKFPKARRTWKLGNHDEWWEKYLIRQAPELFGIPEFSYPALYHTNRLGIDIVRDMRPIRLGKLYVIHGHEYRFPIANPVNPARGLFLRAKTHAICGHFHQTSSHAERNLEQKVIGCWSMGCLSQLHPAYAPLNNYNHGFAIVATNAEGQFEVENYKVFDGVAYRS
jgi:predicted phosphodiesterase